jgi:hypothetical protein
MRIHRGFLGWGIFLILAGSIPLAVRAGYLSGDQLWNVGNLWPLILVGIGVGLLLARTRYGFLGGFIVAATFGVIVGGFLASGVDIGCGSTRGTTPFESRQGPLTGSSASIDIDLSCGDLAVAVAPGNTWRVEGQDRDGTGPNLNADNESLHLWTRDTGRGPLGALGDRGSWRVTLPDTPRLDTTLTFNAGSSTVDLAGARLGRFETTLNAGSTTIDLAAVDAVDSLDVQVNAGSITLTLPNVSVSGRLRVNAGSVALCAAPDTGLRIRTDDSIIASYDFAGLTKTGSTWQTPGYDSAAVKIDLDANANAGSVSLDRSGGSCGG